MSSDHNTDARSALRNNRNFTWLLGGGVISMLGDQFTLIALPWLVLKLTADTLELGGVLAVMSIPRAVFILVGGALVDRHSPKRVLMVTKYVNTVLLGSLAILVLSGSLKLWMIYLLALGIGLASAFSFPSGTAILPQVVGPELLQSANSIMMSLRQLSLLAGPLLAGLLIALFGDGGHTGVANAKGLGFAFSFDAFSFAFSAWTLTKVMVQVGVEHQSHSATQPVGQAIKEGLIYFWNDKSLRALCLYNAAIAFFIGGPIQVAMPVLANERLGQNAAAYGALMAAHGAGTLVGMVASGIKRDFRLGSLGKTLLLINGVSGFLFLPMGQIKATWQGVLLLLVMGTLGGFIQIAVFTWMQKRVPGAMLGRAMSLFMFIFMGLAPLSAAVTGWLMRHVTVGELFVGSGALLIGIVLIAFTNPYMRSLSEMSTKPENEFV